MRSKTEVHLKVKKDADSAHYNPYIHGTHSSVLALLPHTDFTLLSPIEMISRYQIAPTTGEITEGGLRTVNSESKSAFGRLRSNGLNHYTLEKIIRKYATPSIRMANESTLIRDFKNEFKSLDHCSFNKINIVLIYLARAKQAGIPNRALLSEDEEAYIIAHMDASIQFYYLMLLFGNKINPNYELLATLSEEKKKDTLYAISTHLSFRSLVAKIIDSKINLQEIYEHGALNALTLTSVDELLTLPTTSTISLCNDRHHITYIDKDVVLDNTAIFSSKLAADTALGESLDEHEVISKLLSADYHQEKNNFLRCFADKKIEEEFFALLKPLLLNQIHDFQHRFDLFKQLLVKEPSKLLNASDERFISPGFPMILLCENDENMTLINETTMEYRSENPLKLAEKITMIATDSLENQIIVYHYLRDHQLDAVSVVTFRQLQDSITSAIRPIGLDASSMNAVVRSMIFNHHVVETADHSCDEHPRSERHRKLMVPRLVNTPPYHVVPAQAEIHAQHDQHSTSRMDPHLRGDDHKVPNLQGKASVQKSLNKNPLHFSSTASYQPGIFKASNTATNTLEPIPPKVSSCCFVS